MSDNIELNIKKFMQLLAYAFNDNIKPENIEDADWNTIYNFSKKHSVSNIICYAIDKFHHY